MSPEHSSVWHRKTSVLGPGTQLREERYFTRLKHRTEPRTKEHKGWNLSYLDFLEGFQQAQTVTNVTSRKMPPVDKMM